jgi:hypothetical protein
MADVAALVAALVLIAHAILAFTKNRWVTAVIELAAAAVLLWHWWLHRTPRTA